MANITDLSANIPETPEQPEGEAPIEELDTQALTEHLEQSLEEPTEEPVGSDDLPEKYRGKTIKEVVAMHQSAEKRMGQQGSEVGELRGIVDEFIQSQQANQSAPEAPQAPEEEVSFFEDPDAAVERAISRHPEVVRARESAETFNRQSAASQLQQKHPDAGTIVADPAFVEFVKGSPIRRELFARADAQSDVAAADELISQFKDRQGVAEKAAEADKASRSSQLKQASTGSARGTSATAGKRIYKRSDIVALMRDKPDVYQKHAQDIQQAYAEGRVK